MSSKTIIESYHTKKDYEKQELINVDSGLGALLRRC